MKSLILALSMVTLSVALAPTEADAKRIGGGGSAGMQRSVPARTPPAAAPAQPAQATPTAPATAGAAAPAAAPRRSWMGPLAGLAAGLGIAALMSHFGMGAEFGSLITMVLLGLLAVFAVRFLLRRFAGAPLAPRLATPGGMRFDAPAASSSIPSAPALSSSMTTPALPAPSTTSVPADFDAPAFERIAKMIFIRLQAANDSGDLNDLRNFTTPEMFAAIKLDLQERGATAQQTDVVQVDAQVLEVASEAQRQIVSVRFHGLIREDVARAAMAFDEIWHLVRPADGSREWAIAGIQQSAVV